MRRSVEEKVTRGYGYNLRKNTTHGEWRTTRSFTDLAEAEAAYEDWSGKDAGKGLYECRLMFGTLVIRKQNSTRRITKENA